MNELWPRAAVSPYDMAAGIIGDALPDGLEEPDAGPLPVIRLPALAEVAAAARQSRLLQRARRLAAWVGWERPLTSTHVLRRADAIAAITDLGLLPPGDRMGTGMKSARDVPQLHRLWAIAEDLEWIQIGEATTPKAMGLSPSPPNDDGEAMSEWYDALGALLDPDSEAEFVRNDLSWKLVLPRALAALYAAYAEQRTVGPDTLALLLTGQMSEAAWGPTQSGISQNGAAKFVSSAIDVLTDLGATTVDGAGVTLTPIGAFALRYWLAEAGYDTPIVGELTEVEAQELVRRLPACAPQTAQEEIAGWLALRTPVHAAEDLLAVMRAGGPGERCVAAGLLIELGPHAEPAVRAALTGRPVGPYATAWLQDRGLPAPTLTESDRLWLFVDTIAGVLDDDDPRAAITAMAEADPGIDEVLDRVRLVWQSRHPATEDVLIALGRYHPDLRVAEQARMAARNR